MAIKFGDADAAGSSPDRLAQARAVLSEASKAVGLPEAFKEAAIHGQAFVKDGLVLKREEVLAPAPAKRKGFDRAAYQKAYMKTYMKAYMGEWRARRRAKAASSPGGLL